jgi:8-oxo-dGTP diphosphatase
MDGEKPRRRRHPAAKAAPKAALAPAPDLGFTPLATERLTLRPFAPHDAADLHRLINDWEVTRTLALVPFPYQREDAEAWIASARDTLGAGTACHLAITGQEDGREILVGSVGLRLDRASRSGTLGYWIGRRYWGHGVATEAAGRLVRWGLANLDIDRITASVSTDNPASAAVLRKVGFHQTGEGIGHSLARNADHPVWLFEATRDGIFGVTEADPADPAAGPDAKPLLLVAACALVDTEGRVLIARRPEGKKMAGLWEFPGGKLNPGETPEAALIRELKEELGIDVAAACLAPFAFASHAYDNFHLLMPLFLCRRWNGTPVGREKQTLAWVRPQRLADYEMPPADKPLIPLLRDFL